MVSNLGFVGVDALPEHFVAAAGGSGAHIDPRAHAAVRNQGWFNPPHFFLLVQKETGWSLASEAARCISPPRGRAVSISAPGFFLFQTQVKLAFGT